MKHKKRYRLALYRDISEARGSLVDVRDDMPKQEAKQRKCLKCNSVFYSKAPQNRICEHCKLSNPETYGGI